MKYGLARKIIFIVTVAVFLLSTTMVIKHQIEMRVGAEQAEAVIKMVVTPVSSQEEQTKQTESTPPSQQLEDEAENDLIEEPTIVAPIQVDFDALFTKNQDVVAWLYCPNTPNRQYMRSLSMR